MKTQRLMVWVCLAVNHVTVIIATSILRSVHKSMIDSVLLHIDLAFTGTDNIGLWLLFCYRVGLYRMSAFKSWFISQLEIDFGFCLSTSKTYSKFQIHQLMVYKVLLSNVDENHWQREIVVHSELIYGWICICVLSVRTYMHESMFYR